MEKVGDEKNRLEMIEKGSHGATRKIDGM